MPKDSSAKNATLVQLRAFLAQSHFRPNDRLPAERLLCEELGVTRAELRKAFAVLEAEGVIWRHVGRGTFMGSGTTGPNMQSIADLARHIPPFEMMRARRLMEPTLAAEAAMHSSSEQMEQLTRICNGARAAKTWREYETLDNQFHRMIAEATQNRPLLAIFDHLNALRRTVAWGRLRQDDALPPRDHHSFAEHERILVAISERNSPAARDAMQQHLHSVSKGMFGD
ncbi:MAG: DNA-binding FadR family transcriptional regulator [Paracoccaceae bacterium]